MILMRKQTDTMPSTHELLNALPNVIGAAQVATVPRAEVSEEDLQKLGEMSREGLIALVRCLPARITGYALQTKEEKREALKLEVYAVAMSNTLDAVKLKAANDWLDREDGKAIQRIEQKNLNVNVSAPKELTTDELMARLCQVSPAALESAGVRLIEGKVERIADDPTTTY